MDKPDKLGQQTVKRDCQTKLTNRRDRQARARAGRGSEAQVWLPLPHPHSWPPYHTGNGSSVEARQDRAFSD